MCGMYPKLKKLGKFKVVVVAFTHGIIFYLTRIATLQAVLDVSYSYTH